MNRLVLIIIAGTLISCAAKDPQSTSEPSADIIKINVENKTGGPVTDALITLTQDAIGTEGWKKVTGHKHVQAVDDSSPVPTQMCDLDGDKALDQVLFLVSLQEGESKSITLQSISAKKAGAIPARTYAELSIKEGGEWQDRVYHGGDFKNVTELDVPPEHTDHSFYIRYEGPGWESEKVGYRFYLDWRNATDIFGKTTHDLALHKVGLDGFDSYHEMADWGMDILKVGESLGIGSLGCWSKGKAIRMAQTSNVSCSIPVNGPILSMVRTNYSEWATPYAKTDVISEISIAAGRRLSRHSVRLSTRIDSLCTGIVRHPETTTLSHIPESGWGYLATWGKQSLAEDNLGMVIFFDSANAIEITEDEHNHVVVLEPTDQNTLNYYFAACWEQEKNGITTQQQFEDYIEQTVNELNNPPSWSYQH